MDLRELEAESIRAFVQQAADDGYLSGRVLDYGCGKSPYRDVVETAGGEYIGFDRTYFPANVSGENVGPSGRMEARSWDCVLITQVAQYTLDPNALLGFMLRLLKPHGMLVWSGDTNWPVIENEDLLRLTFAGARHI